MSHIIPVEAHLVFCPASNLASKNTGGPSIQQILHTKFEDVFQFDASLSSFESFEYLKQRLTQYISNVKHLDKNKIIFRHICHMVKDDKHRPLILGSSLFQKGKKSYSATPSSIHTIHLWDKTREAGDSTIRLGVWYSGSHLEHTAAIRPTPTITSPLAVSTHPAQESDNSAGLIVILPRLPFIEEYPLHHATSIDSADCAASAKLDVNHVTVYSSDVPTPGKTFLTLIQK